MSIPLPLKYEEDHGLLKIPRIPELYPFSSFLFELLCRPVLINFYMLLKMLENWSSILRVCDYTATGKSFA